MLKFEELKKYFIFTLIASLIASALVAVITVLVGEFTDTLGKVLGTLIMVIIHALVALSFIWDNEKKNTFKRLAVFINTLFILIILSFFTSIFGIWGIIDVSLLEKLYKTYFVFAFAALHGNILAKAMGKEKYLDAIIYSNYIFMAIVVLMLMPIIFVTNPERALGEFYFRILGASAIIDGTLSVLTIIFYKLYIRNHPNEVNMMAGGYSTSMQSGQAIPKKGLSVWVWILIIYLLLQVAAPLLFWSFSL